MNCNEVQNRLSEYVEKALDAETLKTVDDHLASCPRCCAETHALARTMQMVAALREVEPPVGLTTRVMAHVREIEVQPTFLQRLLLPLKIKILLQSTAVVLIGILALYLYQKEPAKNELLSYRQDSSAQHGEERAIKSEPSPSASRDKEPIISSEIPVEDLKQQTKRRQQKTPERPRDASEQTRPTQKESASAGGTTPLEEKKESAVAGRPAPPPPVPMQEKSKATDQLGGGSGHLQSTELAKEPALRSAAPAAARSPLAVPNYDLVVRLREKQALSGQLGAASKHAEVDRTPQPQEPQGLIARYLPRVPASDRPQILILNVPQTDYAQFKKELASLGNIESEQQIGARDKETSSNSDEPLRIRLTILPPRDARRNTPAEQPSPSR